MLTGDWRARAACRDTDPAVFFSPDGDLTEAGRLCGACPVQQACLVEALKLRDFTGFRAGMTGQERKKLLPKGRPPAAVHAVAPEIIRLHTVLGWAPPAIALALDVEPGVVWRVLKEHREQGAAA